MSKILILNILKLKIKKMQSMKNIINYIFGQKSLHFYKDPMTKLIQIILGNYKGTHTVFWR